MNDLIYRYDVSRNMNGTPKEVREYGNGVVGQVWITWGSGKLNHSWGVFGTRYEYRYTARYQWRDETNKLQEIVLARDYHSTESAWRDVDKFASRKQMELAFKNIGSH